MKYQSFLLILIFFLTLFLNAQPSFAYTTNMDASVVVGQPNFSSTQANQGGSAGPNTFNVAYTSIVIQGKLITADYYNHRVLIYNSIPSSNNASADVVIGQTNFTNIQVDQGGSAGANTLDYPWQVATDGTKLFVSDYSNNRVLVYNTVPTSNNASADVVIGQPNMTTTSSGTTSQKLNGPGGMHYDSSTGKFFIADNGNSRVLVYNSIPTSNNAAADLVLGQANFTSGTDNRGGSVAANTLAFPYDLTFVDGKLLVADASNYRVLIWNSLPSTNGQAADLVIGQSNLTSNGWNQGGSVAANTLTLAADVIYNNGELFVNDGGNARVLIYNGIPTSNNASAYKVIGQPNFTSNAEHQGGVAAANTLGQTDGGLAIYNSQLFISDASQHRVLIYNDDTVATAQTTTNTISEPRPPSCGSSAPSTVPDLFQIDATSNTATLYFVTANNPVTYHLLSFGYQENAEQFGAQLNIGTLPHVSKYTVNYLQPNTTYYFKLRGGNGCMPGGWSRIMKVTTDRKRNQGGIIYYSYQSLIKRVQKLILY